MEAIGAWILWWEIRDLSPSLIPVSYTHLLSYTYRQLSRKLTDSFIEKGRGIGNTYIGEFPSFRIDYVLHSPTLYTVGYIREDITLSDHYPIKVKIRKGS